MILALLFIRFISGKKIIEGHSFGGHGHGYGGHGYGGYYGIGGGALDVNPLYIYDDDYDYDYYPYYYPYFYPLYRPYVFY